MRLLFAAATALVATVSPAVAQDRWDWSGGRPEAPDVRMVGPGVRILYPELRETRRGRAFVMRNFDRNHDRFLTIFEARQANRAFAEIAGPRRGGFDWDSRDHGYVVEDRGGRGGWDRGAMHGYGFRQTARGATMRLDDVRIPVERRLGEEGDGLKIALAGLDAGRLGIAAVATGLAQGALDQAVAYAQERETFGKRIIDHQGLAFVLADMEAAIHTSRSMLLHAARLKDAGLPYGREASIAKMVATDNAMKVTTDAVQVFGGYGYTRDFPVERFMREAKVMQIFEGTNQIQRMVISRALDRPAASDGTITTR